MLVFLLGLMAILAGPAALGAPIARNGECSLPTETLEAFSATVDAFANCAKEQVSGDSLITAVTDALQACAVELSPVIGMGAAEELERCLPTVLAKSESLEQLFGKAFANSLAAADSSEVEETTGDPFAELGGLPPELNNLTAIFKALASALDDDKAQIQTACKMSDLEMEMMKVSIASFNDCMDGDSAEEAVCVAGAEAAAKKLEGAEEIGDEVMEAKSKCVLRSTLTTRVTPGLGKSLGKLFLQTFLKEIRQLADGLSASDSAGETTEAPKSELRSLGESLVQLLPLELRDSKAALKALNAFLKENGEKVKEGCEIDDLTLAVIGGSLAGYHDCMETEDADEEACDAAAAAAAMAAGGSDGEKVEEEVVKAKVECALKTQLFPALLSKAGFSPAAAEALLQATQTETISNQLRDDSSQSQELLKLAGLALPPEFQDMAAALKSLGALLEESPASVQKACEIGDDAMTTITTNLAVYNDCAAAEGADSATCEAAADAAMESATGGQKDVEMELKANIDCAMKTQLFPALLRKAGLSPATIKALLDSMP